ncbi:MAG: VTC domain-containing protein [Myxococcota bacterium]|nr:VTC domain-containing protein [Myxococcota bacterium]
MTAPAPEQARTYRYEVKFVAPTIRRSEVDAWIRTNRAGFRTAYPPRRVNNVYFDDYDLRTFDENLTGISRRTKVRFRWYGTHATEPSGTLELKFKRNKLGWKESFRIASLPLAGQSWRSIVGKLRGQLPAHGQAWLDSHPQPVLINAYWRRYFVSADGRVRVTVDEDQQVYDQRFHAAPNLHAAANLPDALIVEVKADVNDHGLAGRAIQGIPLRLARHSKYVVGVQSILVEG